LKSFTIAPVCGFIVISSLADYPFLLVLTIQSYHVPVAGNTSTNIQDYFVKAKNQLKKI